MEIDNPKKTVANGYDMVSAAYMNKFSLNTETQYRSWFDIIIREIESGASVLDLGCGCGIPASQILSEKYKVTGVDISPVQIKQARLFIKNAVFILQDMTSLSFTPGSFAAIVSMFSIIHIPIEEQQELIKLLYSWLREHGLAVLVVGNRAWTGTENDWLGVTGSTMYWSHSDAATYRKWFQEAGFTIIEEAFVPEGKGGFQRFVLRKVSSTN